MATVNLDILIRATDSTRGALVGLRQNLRQVNADASGVRGSLDSLNRSLTGLQGDLQASQQRWQALTQTAAQAGRSISIAGAALLGFSALAMREAMGFDKAMHNVNSIAQLSEGELEKLKQAVKDVASDPTVRDNITTLAEGLYDIYSSGLDGKLGVEALKVAAQGASAGLSSTATSARVLVAAMNAYNMKTGPDAQHIMDVLFKTVDRGVISFEELANSLGPVIGTAAACGVSLEEVGAAIMTMTKRGHDAAISTTALNRVLTTFLNPSKELSAALQRAGYASGAALLKAKGLAGAMEFLTQATGGSVEQLVSMLGEARAVRAALALTGTGAEMFAEDLKAIGEAGGSTMRALSQQTKSFAFQLDKLKQRLGIILDSLGGPMLAVLSKLLAPLLGLLRIISWLVEKIPGLSYVIGGTVLALGLLLGALGPVLMAMPGMVTAWNLLTAALQRNAAAAAQAGAANAAAGAEAAAGGAGAAAGAGARGAAGGLGAAAAGLVSKLGPLALIVMAVVAALLIGKRTFAQATQALNEQGRAATYLGRRWQEMKQTFAGLRLGPWGMLGAGMAALPRVLSDIPPLAKRAANALPEIWRRGLSQGRQLLGNAGRLIEGLLPDLSGITSTITTALAGAPAVVSSTLTSLSTAISGWASSSAQSIADFFADLPERLGELAGRAARALVEGLSWTAGALAQLPATIRALLAQAGAAIVEWVSATWQAFAAWGAALPATIVQGLSLAYQAIVNWVQSSWASLISWAANLPGIIAQGLTVAYQAIVGWAQSTWASITNWVSNTLAAISTWVAGLPARIAQGMADLWQAFTDWLERIWQSFTDFFERIWQGFLEIPRRAAAALRGVKRGYERGAGDLGEAAGAGYQRGRQAVDSLTRLGQAAAQASDELAGHSLTTAAAAASAQLGDMRQTLRPAAEAGINLARGLQGAAAELPASQLSPALVTGQQRLGGDIHIHFDGPTYGLDNLDERIRQGATRASAQLYPRVQYGWSGVG